MSAKALTACSLEPTAEQTAATEQRGPDGLAAEIQFREDLWREYRQEAISAGFSPAQATEYANALSPEMGLAAGVSRMAPLRRGWFYQSRVWVAKRTIASGLIALKRWERSKTVGRAAAAGASLFVPGFRPWNVGRKS